MSKAQVVEAEDSALGTSLGRCLLGLRHSPQILAMTCRGENGETELRAKGDGMISTHSAITNACYVPSPI